MHVQASNYFSQITFYELRPGSRAASTNCTAAKKFGEQEKVNYSTQSRIHRSQCRSAERNRPPSPFWDLMRRIRLAQRGRDLCSSCCLHIHNCSCRASPARHAHACGLRGSGRQRPWPRGRRDAGPPTIPPAPARLSAWVERRPSRSGFSRVGRLLPRPAALWLPRTCPLDPCDLASLPRR